MAKDVGGAYVTLQLVITNESTKRRLEDAIEQIADVVDDYPWLGLDETVERLIEAYEELDYVPD